MGDLKFDALFFACKSESCEIEFKIVSLTSFSSSIIFLKHKMIQKEKLYKFISSYST